MVEVKNIRVEKNGSETEQWGPGWIVEITFNDDIKRAMNNVDDEPVANDRMVLQVIKTLINTHIEWEAERTRLIAQEAANA